MAPQSTATTYNHSVNPESSHKECGKKTHNYSVAERRENIADCFRMQNSSIKLEHKISNSDTESEEISFDLRLESSGSRGDSKERASSSSSPQRQKVQQPPGLKYRCGKCGKELSSKGNLKVHLRVHSGKRPHQCSMCKASFTQKVNLEGHKRIHTGENPYKCSECEASFRVSHSLVTHMRIHTGEKPYRCSECGKTFRAISNSKRHSRTHAKGK